MAKHKLTKLTKKAAEKMDKKADKIVGDDKPKHHKKHAKKSK